MLRRETIKVFSGLNHSVKHVLWPRHYGASRGLLVAGAGATCCGKIVPHPSPCWGVLKGARCDFYGRGGCDFQPGVANPPLRQNRGPPPGATISSAAPFFVFSS
ncbi:hypothetical protein MBAV_000888 [Candidatus Magnetobacterium bavaricum]|uniref:Uncharacterized protein n=1 Tax=Candidatus Magnetobacterium bavaricum TaxID=29290 RepID=A0A0F3GYD5_9BACT|nr:hypothetical protein MBAV_000888 [Candidatus Magnetobacterium bavaricum]